MNEHSAARKLADDWNRDQVTGRVVDVLGFGQPIRTVTRTSAHLLGDIAAIFVEAIRGRVKLEHVRPYDGVGDIPDATRAGGGAQCEVCGKFLRDHPQDLEHLSAGGVPFLTVLCNGRIVKL